MYIVQCMYKNTRQPGFKYAREKIALRRIGCFPVNIFSKKQKRTFSERNTKARKRESERSGKEYQSGRRERKSRFWKGISIIKPIEEKKEKDIQCLEKEKCIKKYMDRVLLTEHK